MLEIMNAKNLRFIAWKMAIVSIGICFVFLGLPSQVIAQAQDADVLQCKHDVEVYSVCEVISAIANPQLNRDRRPQLDEYGNPIVNYACSYRCELTNPSVPYAWWFGGEDPKSVYFSLPGLDPLEFGSVHNMCQDLLLHYGRCKAGEMLCRNVGDDLDHSQVSCVTHSNGVLNPRFADSVRVDSAN